MPDATLAALLAHHQATREAEAAALAELQRYLAGRVVVPDPDELLPLALAQTVWNIDYERALKRAQRHGQKINDRWFFSRRQIDELA